MIPLLIFEHIPKTAGSTMHNIIWHNHPRGTVAMACDLKSRAETIRGLNRKLRDGEDVRALISHCGFGVHKELPEEIDFRHFTMLRDPVDRIISHYFYDIETGEIPHNMPFVEAAKRDPWRVWNVQTAFLSGVWRDWSIHAKEVTPECVTREHLERAMKVLAEEMVVFGLTERFDESVSVISERLGWTLLRSIYVRQRVNRTRPQQYRLGIDAENLIEEATRLDVELYEFAERLFTERYLSSKNRGRFERYKMMNWSYQAVEPVLRPVGRLLFRRLESAGVI